MGSRKEVVMSGYEVVIKKNDQGKLSMRYIDKSNPNDFGGTIFKEVQLSNLSVSEIVGLLKSNNIEKVSTKSVELK